MLSARTIFEEIFDNDEAFRLFCSIAASGEAQGGWENSKIEALRGRIAATRWPSKELLADGSQGVRLVTIQELARPLLCGRLRLWAGRGEPGRAAEVHDRDRRGDIHFIHVKSPHADTLPLIMTHGWPGSVIEMLGVVVPLTDPAAYGGRAEDAFDLVLPSLPGYGLSDEPTEVGWDHGRVAQAWAELMRRLGYTRYVAQGGDVGTAVTDAMGRQATRGAAWHPPQLAPGPAARRLPASGIRAGTRGARRARIFRTSDRATSSTRPRGRRLSATPCWIHPSPWRPGCSTTTPTPSKDLPRLCRRAALRRPGPGQHRRQHHAVLAGRHRDPANMVRAARSRSSRAQRTAAERSSAPSLA